LQRLLGSYETARVHLHKLRWAMGPGRELLSGPVEVDEGYVGGREVGVAGAPDRGEGDRGLRG